MSEAKLIWLSDLHFEAEGLVQGHDPRRRLEAAIDHINAHYAGADLCLITGDMVETATAQNYRDLRRRLERLCLPWVPMTGNHDARELFLEHLHLPLPGAVHSTEGFMLHSTVQPGFAQYAIDLPDVHLICLDSLWEGHDAGELCAERLNWLESRLQEQPDKPTLLFLHHPPIDLGLPMLDPDKLSNGQALMALLARYPQVRQVCCGHVHRPVTAQLGGIGITSLRAVLYQAPAPIPAWDWDSFTPPREAPELGVITVQNDQITIRREAFCAYHDGGPV